MKRLFLYGNLKMNFNRYQMENYLSELTKINIPKNVSVAILCPFIYLEMAEKYLKNTEIMYGSENISEFEFGAYTGEICANMLLDYGCKLAIIGHSERRHIFGENFESIANKLCKTLENNITPIFCFGETLLERQSGKTHDVILNQLKSALDKVDKTKINKIIFAYEPVWAIGTGVSAKGDDAKNVIKFAKEFIAKTYGIKNVIMQYGGSLKPENCEELLNINEIDGGLIGGACLKPKEFEKIINVKLN